MPIPVSRALPVSVGSLGAIVSVFDISPNKLITVTGQGSGDKLVLLISTDDGVTFCPTKDFDGINGNKDLNFPATHMRVDGTDVASGGVTVTITANASVVNAAVVPTPALDSEGASIDISQCGPLTAITVQNMVGSGQISLEISEDDENFSKLLSFAADDCVVKNVNARFIRAVSIGISAADISIASEDADGPTVPGSPLTGVIFQPGDLAGNRRNIYVTWADAFTAWQKLQEPGPRLMLFSALFENPSIPAGTYDMSGGEWGCVADISQTGGTATLTLEDGVFVPGLKIFEFKYNPWNIISQGTQGPVFDLTRRVSHVKIQLGSNSALNIRQSDAGNTPIFRAGNLLAAFQVGMFAGFGAANANAAVAPRALAPIIEIPAGPAPNGPFHIAIMAGHGGANMARNTFTGGGRLNVGHVPGWRSGGYGIEDNPDFVGTYLLTGSSDPSLQAQRKTIMPLSAGPIAPPWNHHVQADTSGGVVAVNLVTSRNHWGEETEVKDTLKNALANNITINANKHEVSGAMTFTDDEISLGPDFLDAGFRPGDEFDITASNNNDGTYSLTSLEGTAGLKIALTTGTGGTDGTGPVSFAEAAGTVTMTAASSVFDANIVGKRVTIAGSTSAGNDGTFVVTAQTATTIDYLNGSGVTEAGSVTAGSYTAGLFNTNEADPGATATQQDLIDGAVSQTISSNGGALNMRVVGLAAWSIVGRAHFPLPAWTTGLAVTADVLVMPVAGCVVAAEATTATAAGPKAQVQNGTPAVGEVDVQYDAAGIATLTFNGTDAATVAAVKLLRS